MMTTAVDGSLTCSSLRPRFDAGVTPQVELARKGLVLAELEEASEDIRHKRIAAVDLERRAAWAPRHDVVIPMLGGPVEYLVQSEREDLPRRSDVVHGDGECGRLGCGGWEVVAG